ncbi:glutathione S-transferase 1-like [Culicoides brevitarsis]|uniref:glutathione S-transferase 1-like n=1 Tax=Culicoides brevitarsis TaxID=469753 RepID=UPI00307C6BEE
MSKPIIYWHPFSAPCRGTWLVAQNLDIDVDFRLLDLAAKEHLKPEFLKINPMHCVPTLDDAGFVIWESRAISTYLADLRETEFYPKNRQFRAKIDSLLYFDATFLYQRARDITRPIIYEGLKVISDEKVQKIYEGYDHLEWFLTKNEFVAGDSLTIADLHLLATIETTKLLGMDFKKHPKIHLWYEKCSKCVTGFNEHVKFTQNYVDMIKSKLQSTKN